MISKLTVRTFVAVLALGATAAGCAPPKILAEHTFVGDDKSVKYLIQRSADNAKLFDLWLRVCDTSGGSTEVKCKDSKVLSNVVPWSLY
jgi:hypothetical protein